MSTSLQFSDWHTPSAAAESLATILVPIDGSTLAEQALPVAAALAQRHGSRIELAIVTTRGLLRGDPAKQIIRRAHAIRADLIIMATHGRTGFARTLGGSVADTVVRDSGVPVLLLRQTSDARPPRSSSAFSGMLILTDGSAESRAVIDAAIAVATPAETTIRLLQVVSPVRTIPDPSLPFGYLQYADAAATAALVGQARSGLEELTASIAARSGCIVDPHLIIERNVTDAIVNFIKRHRVDLIAMATHGRGASRLLVGSVGDAVLRATDLPMLVLRP
ncbi:MAG TPA: universal stress protein [Gemmatimonadaceae bacterium]